VVEGNQRVVDGLAGLLSEPIRFSHTLVSVRRLADGRIRLSFEADRQIVESDWDAVVLAIPFSTLRYVVLDASLDLPPEKRFAIDNLVYGTNSKMMLGFDGRPWFTLHASDGSSFSDLPNHQNTWETNPARATTTSAILTDYSGGARGAALDPGRVSTEALLFLEDLEKVYPGARAFVPRDTQGGPLRVHLENWSRNPLAQGSYTCNHPGYFTTIADNEAPPVGNLFSPGSTRARSTSSRASWRGRRCPDSVRPARCTGFCVDDARATAGMLSAIDNRSREVRNGHALEDASRGPAAPSSGTAAPRGRAQKGAAGSRRQATGEVITR
jgi:monoamine oxidase